MKWVSTLRFSLLPLTLTACVASADKPAATAVASVAENGGRGSPGPTPIVGNEFDGPAHVFTPRQHAPHRAPVVASPELSRLPKLRTQQCFQMLREDPSPKRRVGGLGLSGVGSGGGGIGTSKSGTVGFGAGAGTKPKAARPSAPPAQAPQASPQAAPEAPREAESKAAPPPASDRGEAYDYSFSDDALAEAAEPMPERASEQDEGVAEDPYHDWGASLYLSNDDTMSLSSAQRVLFAIDRFMPLPVEHIRPHELLNYFSFDTEPVAPTNDFSVKAELQARPGEDGVYSLALAVSGRPLDVTTRRNAALSFVIDRSGSMSDEGRMDFLKQGLARMTDELKTGDLINLVLFDHDVCVPVENFVVGRDSMQLLRDTIRRLEPRGSTNLEAGLSRGYRAADDSYQKEYTNRVVMITDAMANTGITDERMIATIGQHYDTRRIRLSGVGVGSDFNDSLLDKLTERGKGAYVFLGSEGEVDAVFGPRFVSLIETVANDVHFRLHLPPSLRMNVFYGEESSVVKEDVQAIHYFAGTSQLFLSDLMARGGDLRTQDSVMLTVEYEHPETGARQVEEFAFNLGQIARQTANVQKGRLVMSFVDGLHDLAQRSPESMGYAAGSWVDPEAFRQCDRGAQSLRQQQHGLESDPEVRRVLELWDRYCARYQEPPRRSVTRTPPSGKDVWPGAAN